jgi:hypothetical protein
MARWETGLERETVNLGMMQYAVYAVLGVYRTSGMPYLVLTLDHGMERQRGMTQLHIVR